MPARFARWGRRHKALTSSAAVLLVVVAVALGVGDVLLGNANARIERERQETQGQRDRANANLDKARQEMGDVLFVVANLARTLEVDPEDSLRFTNAKFVRRFHYVEKVLAERGRTPEQSDLAEMDALWDEAKAAERVAPAEFPDRADVTTHLGGDDQ